MGTSYPCAQYIAAHAICTTAPLMTKWSLRPHAPPATSLKITQLKFLGYFYSAKYVVCHNWWCCAQNPGHGPLTTPAICSLWGSRVGLLLVLSAAPPSRISQWWTRIAHNPLLYGKTYYGVIILELEITHSRNKLYAPFQWRNTFFLAECFALSNIGSVNLLAFSLREVPHVVL